MWETIKADVKNWLHKEFVRIFSCFSVGCLLMGVLMIVVGIYNPTNPMSQNNTRLIIGAVCMAVCLVFFPAVERKTKDMLACRIAGDVFGLALATTALRGTLSYLLGSWSCVGGDILFCIIGIMAFSYFIYVAWDIWRLFNALGEKAIIVCKNKRISEHLRLLKLIIKILSLIVTIFSVTGTAQIITWVKGSAFYQLLEILEAGC